MLRHLQFNVIPAGPTPSYCSLRVETARKTWSPLRAKGGNRYLGKWADSDLKTVLVVVLVLDKDGVD